MALLRTPPVAVILIRSASCLYRCLTALYASSLPLITPSLGPGSEVKFKFKELEGSPCPPVVDIVVPEEKILGPNVTPLFMAFLSEIVIESASPKFLTEVNPASSVFSAFFVALIA